MLAFQQVLDMDKRFASSMIRAHCLFDDVPILNHIRSEQLQVSTMDIDFVRRGSGRYCSLQEFRKSHGVRLSHDLPTQMVALHGAEARDVAVTL